MTLDEYKEKMQQIEFEYVNGKNRVTKKFVLSNNTVVINDVIEDSIGKIMVESIKIHHSSPPQCLYTGIVCKKDGTPTKRHARRSIIQSNMRRIE